MTLRLIIMRHAKSDWSSGAATDHARPLNKRGRRDAPRVANRLRELGWQPDHVVSSDSRRTRETLERMLPQLTTGRDPTVDFTPALYHGGAEELADQLRGLSDHPTTVLALGHNPGWQEAVAWMSGECVSMTTANAALLTCEAVDWLEGVDRGGLWQLVDVVRPKELLESGELDRR